MFGSWDTWDICLGTVSSIIYLSATLPIRPQELERTTNFFSIQSHPIQYPTDDPKFPSYQCCGP